MDFVIGLLKTQWGSDSIFVVVNRFLKITHFIPYKKTTDEITSAQLYYKEVYHLHELSTSNVFDRDTRFLSHFWQSLQRLVETKLDFNNVCHPQIDRQTKVVNRALGDLLHCLVDKHLKSWD